MLIALSDSPVGTMHNLSKNCVRVSSWVCRFFALSFGKHCTKLILYFTPVLLCRAESNEKSRGQRFPTPFFPLSTSVGGIFTHVPTVPTCLHCALLESFDPAERSCPLIHPLPFMPQTPELPGFLPAHLQTRFASFFSMIISFVCVLGASLDPPSSLSFSFYVSSYKNLISQLQFSSAH